MIRIIEVILRLWRYKIINNIPNINLFINIYKLNLNDINDLNDLFKK